MTTKREVKKEVVTYTVLLTAFSSESKGQVHAIVHHQGLRGGVEV
jgi:hypothetical protein